MTAFSVSLQLSSISGAYLFDLHPEAMPCCDDRDPLMYLDIWSFTLRDGNSLRTFVNRVLRTIIVPKRSEVIGDVENCIIKSCVIHIP
jgi:hypothetical protein